MASGSLGQAQLERLEVELERLGEQGLVRVVALHHPPTDVGLAARRRLDDWRALQRVLERVGAELVVHGHRHKSWVGTAAGPRGPIPIVGVRSASDVGKRPERAAQYHLFHLAPGRAPELEVRAYDPATRRVAGGAARVIGAPTDP